jgi:hypothetical protein
MLEVASGIIPPKKIVVGDITGEHFNDETQSN